MFLTVARRNRDHEPIIDNRVSWGGILKKSELLKKVQLKYNEFL